MLARKLLRVVENTPRILYTPREKERGLRSIEQEYKVMQLYRNGDPALAMVRQFEETAEGELGHSSLVKEVTRYAKKMDLQLHLKYPHPTCIQHESDDNSYIEVRKLKV